MPESENEMVLMELRTISSYLREIASFQRRVELTRILADPERRRAYELTDGERTRDAIAADERITKSGRTISRWWSEWLEEGLVDKTGDESVRARYDVHFVQAESDG